MSKINTNNSIAQSLFAERVKMFSKGTQETGKAKVVGLKKAGLGGGVQKAVAKAAPKTVAKAVPQKRLVPPEHLPKAVRVPVRQAKKNLTGGRTEAYSGIGKELKAWRADLGNQLKSGELLQLDSWIGGKIAELNGFESRLLGEMEEDHLDAFAQEMKKQGVKGKGSVAERKNAALKVAQGIVSEYNMLSGLDIEAMNDVNPKVRALVAAQKGYSEALGAYAEALCGADKKGYRQTVRERRGLLLAAERNLSEALSAAEKLAFSEFAKLGRFLNASTDLRVKKLALDLTRPAPGIWKSGSENALRLLTGFARSSDFAPGKIRARILSIGGGRGFQNSVEARKVLDVCGRLLQDVKPTLLKSVRTKIAKEMRPISIATAYGEKVENLLAEKKFTDVEDLQGKFKAYTDALDAYANDPSPKAAETLENAREELSATATKFVDGFKAGKPEDGTLAAWVKSDDCQNVGDTGSKGLKMFCDAVRNGGYAAFKALTGHSAFGIIQLRKSPALGIAQLHIAQIAALEQKSVRFTGDDVKRAIAGEPVEVSDKAMALAMSVKGENVAVGDIKPLGGKKSTGCGAMNEVYMVEVKSGDKVSSGVFKPEISGAPGLMYSAVGLLAKYGLDQQMVSLNVATQKAAGLIGCPNVVVDSKAAFYDGKYGLLMEKAEGKSAWHATETDGYKLLKERLEASASSDDRKKAIGQADSLFRQATDLQWLDRLTGQADRHADNYFVHLDSETGECVLKGIDNDQSFPLGQRSIRFLTLSGEDSVKRFCYSNTDWKDFEALKANMKGIEGVTVDGDAKNPEIRIDLKEVKSIAVKNALAGAGYRTIGLPPVMSEEMKTALDAIDGQCKGDNRKLEAYVTRNLGGLISGKNVSDVAARLGELIRISKETRIVSKGQWTSREVVDALKDGRKIMVSPSQREVYHGAVLTTNYVNRDFRSLLEAVEDAEGYVQKKKVRPVNPQRIGGQGKGVNYIHP